MGYFKELGADTSSLQAQSEGRLSSYPLVTGFLFLVVKGMDYEAVHSRRSIAEIKN
jgi:hypothetical protein